MFTFESFWFDIIVMDNSLPNMFPTDDAVLSSLPLLSSALLLLQSLEGMFAAPADGLLLIYCAALFEPSGLESMDIIIISTEFNASDTSPKSSLPSSVSWFDIITVSVPTVVLTVLLLTLAINTSKPSKFNEYFSLGMDNDNDDSCDICRLLISNEYNDTLNDNDYEYTECT